MTQCRNCRGTLGGAKPIYIFGKGLCKGCARNKIVTMGLREATHAELNAETAKRGKCFEHNNYTCWCCDHSKQCEACGFVVA